MKLDIFSKHPLRQRAIAKKIIEDKAHNHFSKAVEMKSKYILTLFVLIAVFISDHKVSGELGKNFPSTSLEKNRTTEILNHRLPNNSIPLRYDLWLKTDINAGNFKFQGRVKIRIRIVEATQKITLHVHELKVQKINLFDLKNNLVSPNLPFEYVESVKFLIISLPRLMNRDNETVLEIWYNGELSNDEKGFFRKNYEDEFKNRVWFAATDFKSTGARQAMPCYDEPAIQAVIKLDIQHSKKYSAISNMPIVSREEVTGSDYVTTKFHDTLPIPAYLLGFVISDFKFISNNDTKVEQRIYAKPKSIEMGEGKEALNIVGPILKKLEELFEIDFPFQKLDHVAGLQARSGDESHYKRLENYYDGGGKTLKKAEIAIDIAQQYFGSIVGLKWWSHSWMIDGLSVLYGYHALTLLYPNEDFEDKFKERFLNPGEDFTGQSNIFKTGNLLDQDSLDNYVESPEEIENSLLKQERAAFMFYMFQDALTVPTFTKGVKYFLKFTAATPDDLHKELQKAYNEDCLRNGIDIGKAMKTWEDQTSFPILSVVKIRDKFVLTQTSSEIFTFPFSYKSKSGKIEKVLMKSKFAKIPSENEDDFIVLNVNDAGFYEVKYDIKLILGMVEALKQDPVFVSKHTRSSFFSEDKKVNVANLKIMSFLGKENSVLVWVNAMDMIINIQRDLSETSVTPQFKAYLRSLIKPNLDRLGFEEVENDSKEESNLRSMLKLIARLVGFEDYLKYELGRIVKFVETGKGEHEMCQGIKLANQSIHSQIIETFLNTSKSIRSPNVLIDLSCTNDRKILNNFLQLTLAKNNSLTLGERATLLHFAMATGNKFEMMSRADFAFEEVFDFIGENYEAFKDV